MVYHWRHISILLEIDIYVTDTPFPVAQKTFDS